MNIIIAGSRDFTDYRVMEKTLLPLFEKYSLLEDSTIISGTARGADRLGERFARNNDLNLKRMPADWETHKKAAGHIRNKQMLDVADIVICFWDELSRGTAHMIDIAKKKGLPTFVYDFKGSLTEVHHVNSDN